MVDRVDGSIVSVLVRDPCRCFAVKNRRRGCFVGRFVGRIREEIRAVQREEQQHQQQHKEPSARGLHQCAGQLSTGQSEGRESLQGFLLRFFFFLEREVDDNERECESVI